VYMEYLVAISVLDQHKKVDQYDVREIVRDIGYSNYNLLFQREGRLQDFERSKITSQRFRTSYNRSSLLTCKSTLLYKYSMLYFVYLV
jgi:hypothetical protein